MFIFSHMRGPVWDKEGDAGGGSSSEETGDADGKQAKTTDGNQAKDQGNDQSNLDVPVNLWENKPVAGDQASDKGGSTDQNADKPQQNNIDDYVNSLDFMGTIPEAAINSLVDSRDPTALVDHIQKSMREMYKKSLVDNAKMVGAATAQMEKTARTNTASTLAATESRRSLRDFLPAAGNPNIGPIAEAVKSKFISQGADDEAANNSTKKFFDHIVTELAPNLGMSIAPKATPGAGSAVPTPEVEDWASVLKPTL